MLTVDVAASHSPNLSPIPAITQDHANGVLTAEQQVAHIVGLILQSVMIAGIAWSKIGIADTLTIQPRFIETMRRHVEPGPTYLLIERKSGTKIGARVEGLRIFVPVGFDPACLPIRHMQQ